MKRNLKKTKKKNIENEKRKRKNNYKIHKD